MNDGLVYPFLVLAASRGFERTHSTNFLAYSAVCVKFCIVHALLAPLLHMVLKTT